MTGQILKQKQALPLDVKIAMSKRRIQEWHRHFGGKVYVSFSGGKDSTVLLHLVRSLYPDVKAVFSDTGLEYPEIREFVKTFENVQWLKPKKNFKQVLEEYGYPVISKETSQKIHEIRNTKSEKLRSKRIFGDDNGNGKVANKWLYLKDAPFKISNKCCDVLKKNPFKQYEKSTGEFPYTGIMAGESSLRATTFIKNGCNAFNINRPNSAPLSFWTEKDIWDYLKKFNIPYSKIYDMGYERTGCMFCMFGTHLEDKNNNRFMKMKKTHPKMYNYCIHKLGLGKILNYCGIEV